MHVIRSATLLASVALASAAYAQDLRPALDPATIAQGQVIAGTARGYAERDGERTARARPSKEETAQMCANARAMVRRGNPGPRLRRLIALCKQGGYQTSLGLAVPVRLR